ncbi:MAG: class A beta-lactamase-related serine hydrolase, partial [Acidobacteriota bacterium]|nr:class A beta-lactamase-related serine hydrolase [Acidobacteriota bacterium]
AGARLCSCRIGVAARHLESGLAYDRRADEPFEAASVIKIAVLTEAMAAVRDGRVDLAERWTLTPRNKASESGWLKLFDPGLAPTWNDLATLMIGPSDNTATNAWIERLGIEIINSRMDSLGFRSVRLLSVLPWLDPAVPGPRWTGLRFGVATPGEVALWFSRVATGDLLDDDASRRIFRYLDTAPSRARIARRFSSAALWAGKTGTMSGVRNDAGILRTGKGRFVLVVFTDASPGGNESSPIHPAVAAMGDIARAIVDEWSRALPDVGEPK